MMPGRPEPPAGDLARRRPVLAGALLMAVAVGVPLAGRGIMPDLDLFPTGAGTVPYVLGILLAAPASVAMVHGMRRPAEQVSLPGAARSAVRWRDDVPPEHRERVPGWLAWQRWLCAQVVVRVCWMLGLLLQLDMFGDVGGVATQLTWFATFAAVLLLPVAVYAWFMERAGRHFVASTRADP